MRLARFLLRSALLLPSASLFATNTGCDLGPTCNCPNGMDPEAVIALPCGATPLPALSLSGVCAGTASVQDGQFSFGSSTAGTCHVQVTYADGDVYAADVEFSGAWLGCGSNPRGCGQLITPVLPTPSDGFYPTLVLGTQCESDARMPCATSSDCAVEEACLFDVSQGCAGKGSCIAVGSPPGCTPPVPTPICGCDGKEDFTIPCVEAPGLWSFDEPAHAGTCEGDASADGAIGDSMPDAAVDAADGQ